MNTAELDELLFSPTGWFAISANNQAVPRVRIPTLQTGLALIGEGAVATIVGRLQPEVTVIDIDLEGHQGHAATEQLAAWCHRNKLWHLIRPSGGVDGRAHLFVVPGARREDLAETVAQVRRSLRASARAIDLRRSGHIRPLSAPHRSGVDTRAHGDLRAAHRTLRAALRTTIEPASRADSPTTRNRPTTTPDPTTAAAGAGLPAGGSGSPSSRARGTQHSDRRSGRRSIVGRALAPRPRRRKPLPAPWVKYLATGIAPPHGGSDHSRSTDELLATRAMLHAGHSAESAWALIAEAHPAAMAKARANRRRWIDWVWNQLVEADNTTPPPRAALQSDGQGTGEEDGRTSPADDAHQALRRDLHAARTALSDLAWTIPPRRRRALLLVAHHVLDRVERTGQRRIPVPERDLVQDTGLTDRKTIRTALRLITTTSPDPTGPHQSPTAATGTTDTKGTATRALGVLHTDCWDPRSAKDSSSYEFEIYAASARGVSEIPPPSSHTPHPWRPPATTWSLLPGPAHALWRALLASPTPLTEEAAARAAHLVTQRDSPVEAHHRRTTAGALVELARAGLAHIHSDGTWSSAAAPTHEVRRRAEQRSHAISVVIAQERAQYRSADSTWNLQRARAYKNQLARERAWWSALEPHQRNDRRHEWCQRFDALPLTEQEKVKARLAQRRITAGVDENARHRAWVESLPHGEYTRRVVERQHRYAQLAPALQQASVAAWERHRARYNIHRHQPDLYTSEPLYPDTAHERDLEFLHSQASGVYNAADAHLPGVAS